MAYAEMLEWIRTNCGRGIIQTVGSIRLPGDLRPLADGSGWYLPLTDVKLLAPGGRPWPLDLGSEVGIWIDPVSGTSGAHEALIDDCFDLDKYGPTVFAFDDRGFSTSVEENIEIIDDLISLVIWLDENRVLLQTIDINELLNSLFEGGSFAPGYPGYVELSRMGDGWRATDVTSSFQPPADDCVIISHDSSPVSGIWLVRSCEPFTDTVVSRHDFESFELVGTITFVERLASRSVTASQLSPDVWLPIFENGGGPISLVQINPESPERSIDFDGTFDEVAISPDGKFIAVLRPINVFSESLLGVLGTRWEMITVDLETMEESTLLAGFKGGGWRLHWVDDGARIVALADDASLRSIVVDFDTGIAAHFHGTSHSADIASDGTQLIATTGVGGELEISSISRSSGP